MSQKHRLNTAADALRSKTASHTKFILKNNLLLLIKMLAEYIY